MRTSGLHTFHSTSCPAFTTRRRELLARRTAGSRQTIIRIRSAWSGKRRGATERIYHVLESGRQFSPADMLALQTDIHSEAELFAAERFVYAVDHASKASAAGEAGRRHHAQLGWTHGGFFGGSDYCRQFDCGIAALVAGAEVGKRPLPILRQRRTPRSTGIPIHGRCVRFGWRIFCCTIPSGGCRIEVSKLRRIVDRRGGCGSELVRDVPKDLAVVALGRV
jgi:hypothetical protein